MPLRGMRFGLVAQCAAERVLRLKVCAAVAFGRFPGRAGFRLAGNFIERT